jgi:hypothetical protein
MKVGLCARCRHARIVTTPRSRFWRCALAVHDPRFEKYPRLPVLECEGFEPGRELGPKAEESDPGPPGSV